MHLIFLICLVSFFFLFLFFFPSLFHSKHIKGKTKQNKTKNYLLEFRSCESRGGRPGLSVLISLMPVSVDVKQYSTMSTHWSQLVPNMSEYRHPRTLSNTGNTSTELNWGNTMTWVPRFSWWPPFPSQKNTPKQKPVKRWKIRWRANHVRISKDEVHNNNNKEDFQSGAHLPHKMGACRALYRE